MKESNTVLQYFIRNLSKTNIKSWRNDDLRRVQPLPLPDKRMSLNMKGTDQSELMSSFLDLRRPYRILCLDGGGLRGCLTSVILRRIVEHNPQFMNQVDFICGTSAGGILSLMLASGYSPKQSEELFSWAGSYIFKPNPWRALNPFKAKYCDRDKEEIFREYFGERTMGDLDKTAAVIAFRVDGRKSTTHSFFNKEGWRPAVFSNMSRAAGLVEPDLNLKVYEAAMRTSAAPTYFPVCKGYIDGAVVANNPSVIAMSKAMAHLPNVTPRNLVLLSIGSGMFPRHESVFNSPAGSDVFNMAGGGGFELRRADWGIRQWMPFLVDMLLDGDSVTIEMIMHYMLGSSGRYHRLDPILPRKIPMDDLAAVPELKAFAENVDLRSTFRFVDDNFCDDFTTSDDCMPFNALDSASSYHDAWARSV